MTTAGDEALAAVACCIGRNVLRPGDSAGRYGGEEFVIVLPDTDEAGSVTLAEKIRKCVSALDIEHGASIYGHVTVSIGTSTRMADQHTEVLALLKAADEALYQAKHGGRNRVAVYGEEIRSPIRQRKG